ncbi:hypothetical protein ABPG73_015162 [Tetrahymena malaccensis]
MCGSAQCQEKQIYSLITQSCLQCSDSCQNCFNTNKFSCISCQQNLYKSSINSSTCVQKCQDDEYLNENQECVKCSVYGCVLCDSNQKCSQCNQNLQLDLVDNQCILANNVCPFSISFIQGRQNSMQCQQQCSPTYYQNMETKTCEETIKCIQITESSKFSLDQRAIEIKSINQNQYLVAANGCTFASVDKNWNVISIQILQNLINYDDLYVDYGLETKRKSFIIGNQGGCTAGSRLIVMDFQNLEVIFVQDNTIYDYYVLLVDSINQIVFLYTKTLTSQLVLYDVVNRQLIYQDIGSLKINLFFQTQNKTSTCYIIQRSDNSFQVAYLQEDRTILLKNIKYLQDFGQYIFQTFSQKNDYLISTYFDSNYYFTISKLTISQDLISVSSQIEQFQQMLKFQIVYYSDILNSIIQKNQNNILELLLLNDLSEQIVQKVNLTSYQITNFQIFEDRKSQITLAFIFCSDTFQIMNITEFLIFYNSGQTKSYINNFKPLKYGFITQKSQINNVIFQMDNTMDIIISQIFTISYVYQQLIRLKYNMTDQSYQIKYLNPYQFQTLIYDSNNNNPNQNQLVVTFTDKFYKNSFYIIDGNQNFINQTATLVTIKESTQYNQKFHRVNSNILNLAQQVISSPQNYQFSAQINNQYIMLKYQTDTTIFQQVFDFLQEKIILQYNYSSSIITNNFNYIQKRNLLVIQNIPQIFNLSSSEQMISTGQLQFFSLKNYIIINDDFLAYQIKNSQSQTVLYLLDFSTFTSTMIFNFQQIKLITFWTIYSSSFYPVIFNQDIIYFCQTSTSPKCQPFSIQQKNFIMKAAQLQLYPTNNPTAIYQKANEIFIFYYGVVLVCSQDLQTQNSINLGIQYPSQVLPEKQIILQNERYVFYSDQTYFYKFDMELKQFQVIESVTTQTLLKQYSAVDFYTLGSTSYIKKAGNIIDVDNMIVIKSQQEDNKNFIGQIQIDDLQYHIFQSQNGVSWHKNMLNIPFQILNLTSSYILQDTYIQKEQNLIALYDSDSKFVKIYDLIKQQTLVSQVFVDNIFDLKIKMVDWSQNKFIYVIGSSLYLYDPQASNKNQQITQLDSNIVEFQYCFSQKIIVAKTQAQNVFIVKVVLQLKFTLLCSENLLIFYSPIVKVKDLLTGQNSQIFSNINSLPIQNYLQNIPILISKEKLLICFQSQAINYFERNGYSKISLILDYRQNNTNIYYDIKYNTLIGVTGVTKQINVVTIPGDEILFIYNTINTFQQGATYFFQDQTTLIMVDTTPIIYLFNYISRNATKFITFIKDTQGIQMDPNKNFVFLFSFQFISAFTYPGMQFIETLSLQQYNQSNIINVYINQLISVMIVQTSTAFIVYDLTEVIYASETNLLQYQNIKNVFLNENYQIYYSLSNLSLNLFKNAKLVDYLLYELFISNAYPYFTETILISQNQFIYITYNSLNVIQVNFANDQLQQIAKILLQNTPNNFFYDQKQNQIFLLYQQNFQLNVIQFSNPNPKEIFLTNFEEADISNSFICSQYIIIPSINFIQVYNIQQNQIYKIALPNQGSIKLIFKLITKQFNVIEGNWWQIPFENYQRFNTVDYIPNGQFTKDILVLQKQDLGSILYIIDLLDLKIVYFLSLNEWKIMNVINDPYKKLIYIVTSEATTSVLSYTLKQIALIKNPCLKQAIITYDLNFVYSICPNDIIIYNGLSFEQQFPTINNGISEANNIINMNYNNYIIIVQKAKLSIIELRFNDTYKVIYEYYQKNIYIQSFQLIDDINNKTYASLTISNEKNISKIELPLSQNRFCSIQFQQQNTTYQQMYSKILFNQLSQSLQTTTQKISLIEIIYLDGQSIQYTDFQISSQNLDSKYLLSIRLMSQYANKIYLMNNLILSNQIANLFLRDMSLYIKAQIDLNLNSDMENFEVFNISLNLNESLNLQNFKKVYIHQISISLLNMNQITISNCELVIIDNLFLKEVKMHQLFIFALNNNTNVIINDINVLNTSQSNIFQIRQSNMVNITNIIVKDCYQLNNLFDLTQINNLYIENTLINQTNNSKLYYIQSTILSSIQKTFIEKSANNSVIQIQEQDINTVQYLCDTVIIDDIQLLDCVNANFLFESNKINLTNVNIDTLRTSLTVFNIKANQIYINNINVTSTKPLIKEPNINLIFIKSFTDSQISGIYSKDNQISIISINQQQIGGKAVFSKSKFQQFFIQNNDPLILINSIQNIELESLLVENVINEYNYYTSIIMIQNCDTILITDSQFTNCTNSKGPGGVIYATENKLIQIKNSNFSFNKCKEQSGGAVHVYNEIQQGVLQISQSQFIQNKALLSFGGAIYLANNNLILQNSFIAFNEAQIGGGVYYTQIIPDFINDYQNGNKQNNTFKNNIGYIYGQNFSSTLRKVFIAVENIEIPSSNLIFQNGGNIFVKNFKSGNQIKFKKIQLLDEEDNPIKSININSAGFNQLSSDIQSLIQQIGISVSWEQENQQIQCIGQLQTKQFTDEGYSLDIQVLYKPISNMILKLVSNSFSQLKDSKGNIVVKAGQVEQNIHISLDQCSVGEILMQYGNSIACESCLEGKYSLSPLCQSCDTYGDIWGKSYSEMFKPGFCYECQENKAQIIIYNLIIFILISFYVLLIIKRIIIQLEAKLTGYFLNKLDIIYLGSTLNQSDRSSIISKILTDHLQILSFVCTFTVNMPVLFSFPLKLSGYSTTMTSKSIDCILSKYPKLQPLWLYQSICSFALPVSVSVLYVLIGIIFKIFRVGVMNLILLLQFYILVKSKPFIREYFNNLQQKSVMISAFSQNICFILIVGSLNSETFQVILLLFVMLINLIFIFTLIIGLSKLLIPSQKEDRNFFQNIIFQIHKKYPQLLDVQIQNKQKIRSLIKLRKVKLTIKQLMKYLKSYDFYNSQSLQSHFKLKKGEEISHLASSPKQAFQSISTEQADEKQYLFQKNDSIKKLRSKWPYYTRNYKSNQISSKFSCQNTIANNLQKDQPDQKDQTILVCASVVYVGTPKQNQLVAFILSNPLSFQIGSKVNTLFKQKYCSNYEYWMDQYYQTNTCNSNLSSTKQIVETDYYVIDNEDSKTKFDLESDNFYLSENDFPIKLNYITTDSNYFYQQDLKGILSLQNGNMNSIIVQGYYQNIFNTSLFQLKENILDYEIRLYYNIDYDNSYPIQKTYTSDDWIVKIVGLYLDDQDILYMAHYQTFIIQTYVESALPKNIAKILKKQYSQYFYQEDYYQQFSLRDCNDCSCAKNFPDLQIYTSEYKIRIPMADFMSSKNNYQCSLVISKTNLQFGVNHILKFDMIFNPLEGELQFIGIKEGKMMEEEDQEVSYAENEFQVSKEQYTFNKNQKGWYLKHQQAVGFCAKEYNEEHIKYLENEYNIKSQHSKQLFGIQESNTIRYRKNNEGNLESNTKIIEWDDGSYHLMVGDQLFKLNVKEFQAEGCSLYERPNNINQQSFLTDQVIPQVFIDKIGTIQKNIK